MTEVETKPNLVGQWRERLTACAAMRAQELETEPTAEIELAGFRFMGRRLPLREWIRSGRLPAGLLRQMLTERREEAEVDAGALTADEMVSSIKFQRDAILYAVVEPRIVPHDHPAEDEISYTELCASSPELVDALLQWVFADCPGVPVPTKEGSASVETLQQFRQKQPGRTTVRAGADGTEVQHTTESGAGDQG